jgi:hypothetical protein
MSRLRQHPDIVVADRHPYEIKMLTYYALSLMIHTAEADRLNSLDPDQMGLPHNQYSIGRNPFNTASLSRHAAVQSYWEDQLPTALKATFRNTILDYYDAQRISLGRADFRYFAEKTHTDPELRGGVRFLFPEAREIILIRDPRDLLCSYNKFFRTAPAEATKLISAHLKYLTSGRDTNNSLFVRYEDLVADQTAALWRICEYLELPRSDDMLKDEGTFVSHGTSDSPAASIGRWRDELGEAWRTPDEWHEFLTAFEYAAD